MAIPLALPLVPLAPGAAAAAGTFFIGSAAYIAQQVYGFRAPARAPSIPRTGGKAGGATLKELIADVIAGARIPVALPPNPLGPQGSLGLVGVLAAAGFLRPRLAQFWGHLAGPSRTRIPSYDEEGNAVYEFAAAGSMVVAFNVANKQWTRPCPSGTWNKITQNLPGSRPAVANADAVQLTVSAGTFTQPCGAQTSPVSNRHVKGRYRVNGVWQPEVYFWNGELNASSAYEHDYAWTGKITNVTIGGVAVQPKPVPSPTLWPERVTPLPRVAPTPAQPLPLPGTKPTPKPKPEAEPVPQEPGPSRPPIAPPLLVPGRPGTRTLPLPGATPTKDGAIVPQAPAPVPVTAPDAHFPVPGAPPVTGNGPRPTPEGIAQELGRLEQKLARLSDPGPEGPGDGSDRLQLISDLIGRLIEFATSITSGGGYGLSTPCEVDENGERIVTTVNYSGATNALGVLGNKVDALAALIQVHKDLKQPICKQAPAVGQPVTVNFVQVD